MAIIAASTRRFCTARVQYHLRQCFVDLDMHAANYPEVMIAHAAQCFDDAGRLKDEKARELIAELLQNLIDLTRKFQS